MLKFLLLLFLGVYSVTLKAADFLDITVEEVRVYSSPDADAEVVTTLLKGDSVPVSPKSPAGYKKILITEGGKKKIGFIKNADLGAKPPPLRKLKLPESGASAAAPTAAVAPKKSPTLMGYTAVGGYAGVDYQQQGAREYNNAEGSSASISALQGLGAPIVGGFVEFPYSKKLKFRGYLDYKTITVVGTATYKQNTAQVGANDTYLKESFICIGGLAKFYTSGGGFWWGGGVQLDKGLDGQLIFGSYSPIKISGTDLPNFFYTYLGTGYDFPLSSSMFLITDLRLGAIANTSPVILEGDFRLGLAFRL